MKFKNNICKWLIFILAFTIPALSHSQTIGLFYDSSMPQIKFAADDIKNALKSKGFTIEVLPLTSLNASYANKKIVVSLVSDASTSLLLTNQGGAALPVLGEQAYALRTTTPPQTTYWVIGGDVNGAMYGGIELSEILSANGFSGTYNNDEKPFMLNRGMKLNMPLDKNLPTYAGGWDSYSTVKAIPNVWDLTFWRKLIDQQARYRYNMISVWVDHPFPALVKLVDYPNASLPKIEGFDGFSTDMNHNQRVAFWREVMRYARDRGMKFYFFNWNVYLDYASSKYPSLTEDAISTATKDYTYKSMYALIETYPELAGFGISAGDGMMGQPGFNDDSNIKTQWTWETMGKAVKDYLTANPSRKFNLIHRGIGSNPKLVSEKYSTLRALPNATVNFSAKYAMAHMYSTPAPRWSDLQDVVDAGMKTWLTVRNDDYFYINWGDHQFVRDFMAGIPNKQAVTGMYIGSDGYTPSRTYFYKNPNLNGQLEVERRWYMEMLWGRISYNPQISNDVFKNMLAKRFPSVSGNDLFQAWTLASRPLPRVTELIMKEWELDFDWYPEGCNSDPGRNTGFRTVYDFANMSTHPKAKATTVAKGSNLCDIPNSAAGICSGKKSSYEIADEMQTDAQTALNLIENIDCENDLDLLMAINNIKQMAYLSTYYAHKIRGATFLKAGDIVKAKDEMAKAYCWWMSYTRAMANDYIGDSFRNMKIEQDWKYADAAVLKDYTDLGGVGIPSCNLLNHTVKLAVIDTLTGSVIGGGKFISGTKITIHAKTKPGYKFVNWTNNGYLVSKDSSYNFFVLSDVNLIANFQSSASCDVPWNNSGITVNKATVNTTIGPVDISCAKSGVKLSIDVESAEVDDKDYCKIYYKIDNGSQVALIEQSGPITFRTLSATGIKGNKLSIIIDSKNSFGDEFYYIKNIKIIDENPADTSILISLIENGCSGSYAFGGGKFDKGNEVKLKATPAEWCNFVNWTENGLEQSKDLNYTFNATKNRTIQANFKKKFSSYIINVAAKGCDGSTVAGNDTVNEGDNVTVSAKVNTTAKCSFVNWTENGVEVSKNIVYTFVASQNRNLEANFTPSTGIDNIKDEVNIYPNPSSNRLNIEFPNIQVEREINIFNNLGQIVFHVKTYKSKIDLDVQSLQIKGMVVVEVKSKYKVLHYSVLIE